MSGSAIKNIQFLYLKKLLGSFHNTFWVIKHLHIAFAVFGRIRTDNSAPFTSEFMLISDVTSSIHDFFINVNAQIEDVLHKTCVNLAKCCKGVFLHQEQNSATVHFGCLLWSSRHFGVAATLTNLLLFLCLMCSLTSTNISLDYSLRVPMNSYQMRLQNKNLESSLNLFSLISHELMRNQPTASHETASFNCTLAFKPVKMARLHKNVCNS